MRGSTASFPFAFFLLMIGGLLVGTGAGQVGVAQAPNASAMEVADGCSFDDEKTSVEDPASLVDFQDPYQGNASAPVTIVEYFDPNCPHCKTMHAIMKQAVERYGDEAQFVYKPMPLWEYSLPQIEALYAAAQEDKFIPMLEAQYARQQQGGLSMDALREIAREIGMNPDVLTSRVEQQTYRDRILQQRQRAVEIGVDSTPTVLVNGRFIDGQSRTLECIGAFIDAAQQNATSSASG